jgi:DNA-binding response OmpR family regulator
VFPVLLIEDDASIARFVAIALEDLPVALTHAPALGPARERLAQGPWALVISDLMLPDGTALDLLRSGIAQAAGAPPWVVFSAGLTPARLAELEAAGVTRTLHKPVALIDLLSCVEQLLGLSDGATAPAGVQAATADTHSETEQAIAAHFGGDRALFESFRAGCLERFAQDLDDARAAIQRDDSPSLRRVAHSLKSVLTLIGLPALSAQARELEQQLAALPPEWGPVPAAARVLWQALAQGLQGARSSPAE